MPDRQTNLPDQPEESENFDSIPQAANVQAPKQMSSENPDFLPTASIETLKQRAAIVRRIRNFFDSRGFFEVETPALSHDTVADRYIEPIAVSYSRARPPMFLQTSPEFAMKRLLAGGAKRIYQVAHVFRREESGPSHNVEFTMLEWYEAGADYECGMTTLEEFATEMFVSSRTKRVSYRDAFRTAVGFDPLQLDVEGLRAAAGRIPGSSEIDLAVFDRDNLLNWILARHVQPTLGLDGPMIVFDWPASQSALARTRRTDDGVMVAERFELYVGCEELANGYHELVDGAELLRRNREVNELRQSDSRERLPESSRLLAAMQNDALPSCSGTALGVDRLVMKMLGLKSIDQVIPFPFDRA